MKYIVDGRMARWSVVEGEAVVVNVESSYYYGLNRTGTLIWNAIVDRAQSADELAQHVVDAYGIEATRARADVDALLVDLTRESLIMES